MAGASASNHRGGERLEEISDFNKGWVVGWNVEMGHRL